MVEWEDVPLFDENGQPNIQKGRDLRDAALEQVEANADPDWNDRAKVALQRLALSQPIVVADDMWKHIERPREPRALGPIFMWAKREGLLAPTDRYVACTRPSRHVAPLRVWESLVHKISGEDEVDLPR